MRAKRFGRWDIETQMTILRISSMRKWATPSMPHGLHGSWLNMTMPVGRETPMAVKMAPSIPSSELEISNSRRHRHLRTILSFQHQFARLAADASADR